MRKILQSHHLRRKANANTLNAFFSKYAFSIGSEKSPFLPDKEKKQYPYPTNFIKVPSFSFAKSFKNLNKKSNNSEMENNSQRISVDNMLFQTTSNVKKKIAVSEIFPGFKQILEENNLLDFSNIEIITDIQRLFSARIYYYENHNQILPYIFALTLLIKRMGFFKSGMIPSIYIVSGPEQAKVVIDQGNKLRDLSLLYLEDNIDNENCVEFVNDFEVDGLVLTLEKYLEIKESIKHKLFKRLNFVFFYSKPEKWSGFLKYLSNSQKKIFKEEDHMRVDETIESEQHDIESYYGYNFLLKEKNAELESYVNNEANSGIFSSTDAQIGNVGIKVYGMSLKILQMQNLIELIALRTMKTSKIIVVSESKEGIFQLSNYLTNKHILNDIVSDQEILAEKNSENTSKLHLFVENTSASSLLDKAVIPENNKYDIVIEYPFSSNNYFLRKQLLKVRSSQIEPYFISLFEPFQLKDIENLKIRNSLSIEIKNLFHEFGEFGCPVDNNLLNQKILDIEANLRNESVCRQNPNEKVNLKPREELLINKSYQEIRKSEYLTEKILKLFLEQNSSFLFSNINSLSLINGKPGYVTVKLFSVNSKAFEDRYYISRFLLREGIAEMKTYDEKIIREVDTHNYVCDVEAQNLHSFISKAKELEIEVFILKSLPDLYINPFKDDFEEKNFFHKEEKQRNVDTQEDYF